MERVFRSLVLTLLLVVVVHAQDAFKIVEKNRYAPIWNDIEASIARYNAARIELGENLTAWPPWKIVSEVKEQRRRELYEIAIKEAELQVKLYKKLKEEDR